MINHGIEDELGMFISIFADAKLNLFDVGSAKVSVESSLSCNALQELLLTVLTTETETDEISCRKTAGTLRREGTFAIKGIVGIDSSPMVMGSHGDASSKMADDEIEVFVAFTYLLSETSRNSSLVECVPDTDTVHEWRP